MKEQGYEEPTGKAKVTKAYNLPSKYVIHTVGPIICGSVTEKDQEDIRDCYRSCLNAAEEYKMNSIAFCCISTGEFHFPNKAAASIAIETVQDHFEKNQNTSLKKVIFNIFKDIDLRIYTELLYK